VKTFYRFDHSFTFVLATLGWRLHLSVNVQRKSRRLSAATVLGAKLPKKRIAWRAMSSSVITPTPNREV
jgi:hypothetical protein